MGGLERGSAHGPVTRAAAHAQQHAGSRGRARQERRTADDVDDAPLTAHLLRVLEVPRQPVVGAGARPAHVWTCVTEFEPTVENARIGQGLSRERGAEGVAVRGQRATHPHRRLVTRLQQPERLDGGAGRDDYRLAERCFSSARVGENGVRVGLNLPMKYDRLKDDRGAHPTPCCLAPALNRIGVNWRAHEGAPLRLTPCMACGATTRERPPKGTHKIDY